MQRVSPLHHQMDVIPITEASMQRVVRVGIEALATARARQTNLSKALLSVPLGPKLKRTNHAPPGETALVVAD